MFKREECSWEVLLFSGLCLEDFAVVSPGLLEEMGGDSAGQFGAMGTCWSGSSFRLVCFPLLCDRDWGCDSESICSWGLLLFKTLGTRVFFLLLLMCDFGDFPVSFLGHQESFCQR